MVVKSKRGRRRYVAFTVDPSLTKESLIARLRAVCDSDVPYIIQCSEGWCIVRCAPKERCATMDVMSLADPTCVSLRTSGTVITLRKRYPELMRLRPPPKRR